MTTITPDQLTHRAGCDSERIDVTEHIEVQIVTLHCVDCSAHAAYNISDGALRPEPTATGPLAGLESSFTASMTGTNPNVLTPRQYAAKADWNNLTRKAHQ